MALECIEQELRKKAYLIGKSFSYAKFEPRHPNDHTFCVFCWARIGGWEEDLHEGYFNDETRSWVCDICIEEYESHFGWKVEKTVDDAWHRLIQNKIFDIPLI